MKIQTARVVLMSSVVARPLHGRQAPAGPYRLNYQPNLDDARRAAASICAPRSARSTQRGRSKAVIHQRREKMWRSYRWANASRDKFANTQPLRLRTSRASREAGKTV